MTELRAIAAIVCFGIWVIFVAVNWLAIIRRLRRGTNDSIVPLVGTAIGLVGILVTPWRGSIILWILAADVSAVIVYLILSKLSSVDETEE